MTAECPNCGAEITPTTAAAALGSRGGSTPSEARAAAARENGRRGGRPTAGPRKVARVFEGATGWFYCDDALDYLDERGPRFASRREAIAGARDAGEWTHYATAGGRIVRL